MSLKEKIKNLPRRSGVYIFRDEFGRIIYIGKAADLKSRVSQYFQASDKGESPRRQWLRRAIADLEYIIVNTPVEALILEADLIKRHRPPFNVRMKDDKRYPYIEITYKEKYPRIRITRRTDNKDSRYFGPYTSSAAMRQTFKLIQKVFKIRTCKYDLKKLLDRPCLDYHINLCKAPCTGYISAEEYLNEVKEASLFLDGKNSGLTERLRRELEICSQNLDFEKCIYLRDLISSVELVTEKRQVVTSSGDDADFAAIVKEDNSAAVAVMQVRDGRILGQLRYYLEVPAGEDGPVILRRFIMQYYRRGFFIPPRIFLSCLPDDLEEVEEWLSSLRGKNVEIKAPQRGERREILRLAEENALEYLSVSRKLSAVAFEKNIVALESLRDLLWMEKIPSRIEGYDISNISGELAVASMVVFIGGEPYKSHYRRFRMSSSGPDDFAMINEALDRRLKNLILGEQESFRDRPDLILIDGGKGQLSAAVSAAEKNHIRGIRIISLAKSKEEIFVPERSSPIPSACYPEGLNLLKRIRDEAHRFALSYHRKLRSKKMEVSVLDKIPGVSRKRKEILLSHFDSIEDISKATLYELAELPGFNRKVAEAVLRVLGTAF